jgi:hypothetical protein
MKPDEPQPATGTVHSPKAQVALSNMGLVVFGLLYLAWMIFLTYLAITLSGQ